jgi:hypothetical protein
MVIRPAREPGSPGLERQYANCCPGRFNDVRPPGAVREAGQGHAERVAHKVKLPWSQLQEGHRPELDGARVRPQVVEGNEPDGLAGDVQLDGVSVSPAGALSAGGPAGSIHMTSQR